MKNILEETFTHWKGHNATRMGAALSYYAMLSFLPLLVLLIAASSLLFSTTLVQHTLIKELNDIIGHSATSYISGIMTTAVSRVVGIQTVIVSGLTLIIGALGMFSELDSDLDQLWEMKNTIPSKKKSLVAKVGAYLRTKFFVLPIIPLLALLLILSVGVTVFLSILRAKVSFFMPLGLVIGFLQVVIPFVLSTTLFLLVYRILPDRKLPWKMLWVGALSTAVFFIFGNILIGWYMKVLVHTNVFGSASSLVGLLVWIYYSAQVFFLGASFTFVLAKRHGFIHARG